jgi:hypothetical protein
VFAHVRPLVACSCRQRISEIANGTLLTGYHLMSDNKKTKEKRRKVMDFSIAPQE